MNDELKNRVDDLYDDVMTVIEAFAKRYGEPLVEDNIYNAVITRIRDLDPTVLNEICPEITLRPRPEGTAIQIFYHRIH